MGTRNLTAVVINGEYKVAQYGQWDGYPEGQGVTILAFLKNMDEAAFRKRLEQARFVGPDEVHNWYLEAGSDGGPFVSMDVHDKVMAAHPFINRDHGGAILELIAESEGVVDLTNSLDFVADSLFCEWAYVVDFDKRTFEVYQGSNHEPLDPSERFAGPASRAGGADGPEYHPVKHVVSFSLDALPTEPEFLKVAQPQDGAEDAA